MPIALRQKDNDLEIENQRSLVFCRKTQDFFVERHENRTLRIEDLFAVIEYSNTTQCAPLIKMIHTSHNLYVNFKSASLYCGLV